MVVVVVWWGDGVARGVVVVKAAARCEPA